MTVYYAERMASLLLAQDSFAGEDFCAVQRADERAVEKWDTARIQGVEIALQALGGILHGPV